MSYIYKIINNVNQKLYIGKTAHLSIQERFKEHINDSIKNEKENRPLYKAFKKYGIENFSIELIEEVSNDIIAAQREYYWINTLNTYIGFNNSNGYNATLGGDGKRLYDYKLLSNEYQTLGTVKAVCEKYNCDGATVKQACFENNIIIQPAPNQRKIKRTDKNNNIIIYDSITDAARSIPNKATETARKNISRVLTRNQLSAYGYKWEYVE